MSNTSALENSLTELLKLKQFSELKLLLTSKENEAIIKDNILNLINIVCSTVEDQQDDIKELDVESYSNTLLILVGIGNPKEVIIGLLEFINKFNDDVCFQFLLNPIQKTLFLIPKRENFFEYALDITYAHFYIIPKPEEKMLEGEELMLLDLDENVQRTSITLSKYFKFLKPFIEEVCGGLVSHTLTDEQITNQRITLQNYILKLLYHPLIFQDLHFLPCRQMSAIQSTCEKLLIYLAKMCKNLLNLYLFEDHKNLSINDDAKKNISSETVPSLAYGNLAYLLFAENILPQFRPYVYSLGFLFENHMLLITMMFEKNNCFVIYKAMHLFKHLLDTDFTLPATDLPLSKFVQLPKALIRSATYCTIESYRKLLGTLFVSYIKKFTWDTRYPLLLLLMENLANLGVESTLIDLYRNFLHEARQDENILKYFVGKNLHSFLRKALYLKNGVKTDVLENQKSILSGLSTLRYLILADSKEINFTGIFHVLKDIRKSYLDPLQLGLDISKAHYLLEVNNVSKSISTRKSRMEKASVTVSGETRQISPIEHLHAMKQALVSLDLIQSILSHVFEILDQKFV